MIKHFRSPGSEIYTKGLFTINKNISLWLILKPCYPKNVVSIFQWREEGIYCFTCFMDLFELIKVPTSNNKKGKSCSGSKSLCSFELIDNKSKMSCIGCSTTWLKPEPLTSKYLVPVCVVSIQINSWYAH